MTMPPQKPHRSRQDYETPPELITAVEQRFGPITWDVAATAENAVIAGSRFFSPDGIDALTDNWSLRFLRDARELLWLNPPFGAIATDWAPLVGRWTRRLPWLRLVMLTPASVGSEWFQAHVHRRAMVLALSPRLTFVGAADPYPKDCMLSCYGFGVTGFDVWRWDEDHDAPRPAESAPGPAVKATRARAKSLVMA
jgi:hypothetical protein